MNIPPGRPTLPREVAPGLFWLSGCAKTVKDAKVLHSHASCYLLCGSRSTVLIDAGMSRDWAAIESQLEKALAGRRLDFIFPTHPEIPHMGNLEPLMVKFDQCRIVGDLRNYHLFYPQFSPRFLTKKAGDSLDLGGRELLFIEPVVRDLPNTLWAYEASARVLFACDAYCFTHEHHLEGECAMMCEELPYELDVVHTTHVLENGLSFTRYVDPEQTCADLDACLDKYSVALIAPTHGAVTMDPRTTTKVFQAGLRAVRKSFYVSQRQASATA
jgi:flavorubredoxin